ncbi:competence type IV pilus major pilin ComGC [Erysipelothrix aquatica]|uniref:competence type IV pilus major pilin ComGC n=1 Tax=Erysipelothrix aquatica TaxID=2683714 RepID=UPI0013598AEA|nr:competence type IV pilus major pilin ComGC [Erysipelothrix aquatica]
MKKGFTLIEMVLVMAVIVVLLLLTMPNIQRTLNVINEKGCDAQLKIIDAAILQWQLKHDGVPVSIQDLVTDEFITERQTRCSDGKNIEIVQGQATIQ